MDLQNNATKESGGFTTTMLMFNWAEYLVFGAMLGLSALIGIYYGCYKGNQNTVSEYMQGGKKMGVFPITMSLVASYISGIALLGVPSETYTYGTQYLAVVFSKVIVGILVLTFYLPVFYKLQLNSPYEYLERRFNHKVRVLTSLIFALSIILYTPVVIYGPAVAVNQVSGLSVHVITPVIYVICIFYTTLGGLKAVVWADAFQSLFMFGSMVFVIILGCIAAGGPTKVFETSYKGGRLELFNLDPDPLHRNTFWTVTIGSVFMWLAQVAVHPAAIQRYTAVPTYKSAVKCTCWFVVGISAMKLLTTFIGLLMYTQYRDCDPIASKAIKQMNQILPLYVMDVAGQFTGLTGLFISGVVSAALSTMSSGINTVAGTIYEDLVMSCCGKRHSDARASFIMKIIVVILGSICVALVFFVEKLGGILQISTTVNGITSGALIFVFTFGMFFPWATSKGALAGLIASMAGTLWISAGAQTAIAGKRMTFPGKITSVDGCPSSLASTLAHNLTSNYTGVGTPVITDGTVLSIYQLSYHYYSTAGFIIGLIVGLIVTCLTGFQDIDSLDPDLIIPQMQRFLPKKSNSTSNNVTVKNEYTLVRLKSENDNEQIS